MPNKALQPAGPRRDARGEIEEAAQARPPRLSARSFGRLDRVAEIMEAA